jgi:hypothetical protein
MTQAKFTIYLTLINSGDLDCLVLCWRDHDSLDDDSGCHQRFRSPDRMTTIDLATSGGIAPFWLRCIGAGRANEALRASWLEHLQLSRDRCGAGPSCSSGKCDVI